MSATTDPKTLLAERKVALASLDLDWARRRYPWYADNDQSLLIVLHQSRYGHTGIDLALRRDSRDWLHARGLTGMCDQEFQLPDEELVT